MTPEPILENIWSTLLRLTSYFYYAMVNLIYVYQTGVWKFGQNGKPSNSEQGPIGRSSGVV